VDRVVGPDDDGLRLDVVLAGWLDLPRGPVQRLVRDGAVTVDGQVVAKSHRVRDGEHIKVLQAQADSPPAAAPLPAVPLRFEDEHLAIVAKPAGLVVHAGAGTGSGATLVGALQSMGMTLAPSDDPERPGIVHRLDRGTSGLLVVAKTEQARRGLASLFRRHATERRYWAIVDGVPRPPHATIDAPIGRSATNRTKFTVVPGGRRAVSHYDVAEDFGRAAIVTVRLETGRTHQVRVHMAAVGHPVTGDRAYGASSTLRRELDLSRPALHAAHLAFDHPVTGERIAVDEPLPQDLVEAHARLAAGAAPRR
jgi:23S rRNA pseudouridine1911/1915/1917 synthase